MSLITSRAKKTYNWQKGDLLSAADAAELLGWNTARNLQGARLNEVVKDFAAASCTLTTTIWVGGQRRFLRSEIDEYLTKIVSTALNQASSEIEKLGTAKRRKSTIKKHLIEA